MSWCSIRGSARLQPGRPRWRLCAASASIGLDVVIAELVRDPRWIALAGLTPRIQLVHGGGLHDTAERRPAYERAVFDRWGAGSAATITYSDYVRGRGRHPARRGRHPSGCGAAYQRPRSRRWFLRLWAPTGVTTS